MDYLNEQKWLIDNCHITKAYPNTGNNSSQNLGNLGHTVQPAWCSTGWRMSIPSGSGDLRLPQEFGWFLLLPGNWSGRLHHSMSCLRVTYCSLQQVRTYWIWLVPRTSWSYFELFTFLFKDLPWRMECFNVGGNCYTTTSRNLSKNKLENR